MSQAATAMGGTATVQVRGETLLLHPQRAVIWPSRATLIVADIHFGKSGVFGRHGLAVPGGADEADRGRLRQLIRDCAIRRLIVLGDFLHAPVAADGPDARALDGWIESLGGIVIQVIAGNHDRGITGGWRGAMQWLAGEHVEAPFRFLHDAATSTTDRGPFSLSGHVHPVIAIGGLRKRAARVPAFWLREQGLILPSFGLFTGGQRITAAPGERVFAVSPDRVVPFPTV